MKQTNSNKGFWGVGVEWTEALEAGFIENFHKLSCFELIPENFFHGRRDAFLKSLRDSDMPVLVHAVELSFGSDEPLKQKHLDNILEVADKVNTINISDHLCLTEAGGVEIGQLTPLPWTMEACDVACRKIDEIQSRLAVPFLIENITNRFIVPNAEMEETEFFNRILERTGCSLLLDLNNIHTNAINFNFDPYQWIDAIDLKKVVTIHLAGGFYDDEGTLIDSHSKPVPPRVWELYRYVCRKIRPPCTIVEWTDTPPPMDTLLADVDRARAVLQEECLSEAGRPARRARSLQGSAVSL